MPVDLLAEGQLDSVIGARLIRHLDLDLGTVYGRKGIDYIRAKVGGFNNAAHFQPILTLADLGDTGTECAPEVVRIWLPSRRRYMLLRFAVNKIESWLLADRANLARFLNVRQSLIPYDPDILSDPKVVLLSLARRSRNRHLQRVLLPPDYSTARQGPGYVSEMSVFVDRWWEVDAAAQNSQSLRRCVQAMRRIT